VPLQQVSKLDSYLYSTFTHVNTSASVAFLREITEMLLVWMDIHVHG